MDVLGTALCRTVTHNMGIFKFKLFSDYHNLILAGKD